MDLQQSLELIKAGGAVATGTAAWFAAWTAYRGLNKWQIENLGKRRAELAEEALASFYQIRDVMRSIRSPFGYAGEGDTRKADPNETTNQTATLNRYYKTVERYHKKSETISGFHSRRYRMRALFGQEANTAYDNVDEAFHEVLLAAQMLMDTAFDDEADDRSRDDRKEWKRIVYSVGPPDKVGRLIDDAIAQMEKLCRPILEEAGRKGR